MCLLHPRSMTTGAPPHKQPGTTAVTLQRTLATQVVSLVSQLHSSVLMFMGHRDTKYDPNFILNLSNYNSIPIVTKLYRYSTNIEHTL